MPTIRPKSARCSPAAREGAEGRVIAVMQPHRYTRLQALMDDFQNAFNDADVVFVTPVYAAGEEPIEGVDSDALVEGLRAHGHRMVRTVDDLDELCRELRDLAADGDMVICMGAGDITKWAAALADGIWRSEGAANERASTTLPAGARQADAECAAGAAGVVQERRQAQWLFEPAGRGRSGRISSASSIREVPVMALGLGSNLIVRDGGVPGVVVRLGKAFAKIEQRRRDHAALRRRRERDPGLLDRARRRHCRPRIPARHSRHGRRLRPHERRRLRPRGQDILVSARLVLRSGEVVEWPLDKLGYTYRHSDVPEGAVVVEATFRGTARRSRRRSARRWTRSPAPARNRSRCAAAPAARPSRTRRATRRGRWSMRRAAAA